MFCIRSTYSDYSPDYEAFPHGRDWPPVADRAEAWQAVRQYLLDQQWQPVGEGLAPFGHVEATSFPVDNVIINDAEMITIVQC